MDKIESMNLALLRLLGVERFNVKVIEIVKEDGGPG